MIKLPVPVLPSADSTSHGSHGPPANRIQCSSPEKPKQSAGYEAFYLCPITLVSFQCQFDFSIQTLKDHCYDWLNLSYSFQLPTQTQLCLNQAIAASQNLLRALEVALFWHLDLYRQKRVSYIWTWLCIDAESSFTITAEETILQQLRICRHEIINKTASNKTSYLAKSALRSSKQHCLGLQKPSKTARTTDWFTVQEIMRSPVHSADGHTYEKHAIEDCFNAWYIPDDQWSSQHQKLRPNLILKQMIKASMSIRDDLPQTALDYGLLTKAFLSCILLLLEITYECVLVMRKNDVALIHRNNLSTGVQTSSIQLFVYWTMSEV